MITPAYRILTYRDFPCLLCLICNSISHNPNDVRYHYCGACHRFLDDVPRDEEHLTTHGRSPGLLLEGGWQDETGFDMRQVRQVLTPEEPPPCP